MIYFAQSPDGGTIKIGHSVDVPSRIKALESHYGQPLAILATVPGGRNEERTIHERFAAFRLGRSEQFRPAPAILAYIGRPLLVSPDPDAVEVMDKAIRPTPRAEARETSIRIRMTDEFKAWLENVATRERLTVAAFIERAIVDCATHRGHPEAPGR